MNAIVVYSSQTGNTKKLAETVCEALPTGTQMCLVDEAPDPTDYDLVALGFWFQAGKPDPKSASYLARLKGHKKVFLFATHGARPGSDHAASAMAHAQALAEGATVAGSFSCYGEVNPNVLEKVKAKPLPPVWLDDAADAVGHPDASDMDNLRRALKALLE
ncbi:flavodoxin family protein [Desulfosarcina sp.]|uniref:flavodoxin family protein n=1 Tax=Desulfosarcina sp. TaxID=2027861 RepID=UPI0035678089